MAVFRFSRFTNSIARRNTDDQLYLGEREPFVFQELPDTIYHIAREGDTWFNLAGLYYRGMPRGCGLWWALCDFQNPMVIDPTLRIVPGTLIAIPSESTVRELILAPDRRRMAG
jgi:hypothetical protein